MAKRNSEDAETTVIGPKFLTRFPFEPLFGLILPLMHHLDAVKFFSLFHQRPPPAENKWKSGRNPHSQRLFTVEHDPMP
jgi:hypothetical protein